MEKIAFVFAGQGAQYPGMGRSLCNGSPAAREIFRIADHIRPGTSDQCFSGTGEELRETANTQPCVFTADLAAAAALREKGICPQATAGFSLGELSALAFSGAFSMEDAFCLVCSRGELMQKAARKRQSGMAAVLKLSAPVVEELCGNFLHIYPVNYNCPGQIVVSGTSEELEAFCRLAESRGGKVRPLAVSGGFHSPFMAEASDEFLQILCRTEMHVPGIPVYSNRTALPYKEDRLRELLSEQICHPVLWQQTVQQMAADGVNIFIEVGPGKTLSGLIHRILPETTVYHVQDEETLQETLEALRVREEG